MKLFMYITTHEINPDKFFLKLRIVQMSCHCLQIWTLWIGSHALAPESSQDHFRGICSLCLMKPCVLWSIDQQTGL